MPPQCVLWVSLGILHDCASPPSLPNPRAGYSLLEWGWNPSRNDCFISESQGVLEGPKKQGHLEGFSFIFDLFPPCLAWRMSYVQIVNIHTRAL